MAKSSKLAGIEESPQLEARAVHRLNSIYKQVREKTGLNQTTLANRMGLKQQSAVSQYFHAKVPLNSTAVLNFAQALGVSPMDIYPEMMSPVRALFSEKTTIQVTHAIIGEPSVASFESVTWQDRFEPYAVEINVDSYLPYILHGTFYICSHRIKPKNGDDIYIELNNSDRFIGRFFSANDDAIHILKLQDNRYYDLSPQDVITCDVIIGTHRSNVGLEFRY